MQNHNQRSKFTQSTNLSIPNQFSFQKIKKSTSKYSLLINTNFMEALINVRSVNHYLQLRQKLTRSTSIEHRSISKHPLPSSPSFLFSNQSIEPWKRQNRKAGWLPALPVKPVEITNNEKKEITCNVRKVLG